MQLLNLGVGSSQKAFREAIGGLADEMDGGKQNAFVVNLDLPSVPYR